MESVTDMWLTLRHWVLDMRNRFLPYILQKTDKGPPWIRSKHRRARLVKNVVFFLFKANRTPVTLSVYKAESKRLLKLMRISIRQYESKLADELIQSETFLCAYPEKSGP